MYVGHRVSVCLSVYGRPDVCIFELLFMLPVYVYVYVCICVRI